MNYSPNPFLLVNHCFPSLITLILFRLLRIIVLAWKNFGVAITFLQPNLSKFLFVNELQLLFFTTKLIYNLDLFGPIWTHFNLFHFKLFDFIIYKTKMITIPCSKWFLSNLKSSIHFMSFHLIQHFINWLVAHNIRDPSF